MPAKADAPSTDERVMIFIDGSNLYHVLTQNCGRHDLVFDKFIAKLGDGRHVKRTYYYNIRQDPTYNPQASAEQQKFLSALYETPYFEIRLGVHRRQGDQMVEKGVDVMMATDVVVGAFRDLYDTAIIVSGDGDFYPAMQVAKDLGKHVEVFAFESNLSPEAKRVADVATLVKKSFFTGLWTTRRRTTTKKSDDDETEGKKPATRRRTTRATSESDGEGSESSSRRSTSSRRRPARSASRTNGTAPTTDESGSDSEESADSTPTSTPTPTRRRRVLSRRSESAEEALPTESDDSVEPAVSENGASSDSGNGDESGGGNSWWSRRRGSRSGSDDSE